MGITIVHRYYGVSFQDVRKSISHDSNSCFYYRLLLFRVNYGWIATCRVPRNVPPCRLADSHMLGRGRIWCRVFRTVAWGKSCDQATSSAQHGIGQTHRKTTAGVSAFHRWAWHSEANITSINCASLRMDWSWYGERKSRPCHGVLTNNSQREVRHGTFLEL